MEPFNLVPIEHSGDPSIPIDTLPDLARQVAAETVAHYERVGFQPPWTGYFALAGEEVVGACAFKTSPRGRRVEIAYGTFPEFQGRGFATAMARALIAIAREADPSLLVFARTLPRLNASTSILKKLGFKLAGEVDDPEDGKVWEWYLAA